MCLSGFAEYGKGEVTWFRAKVRSIFNHDAEECGRKLKWKACERARQERNGCRTEQQIRETLF